MEFRKVKLKDIGEIIGGSTPSTKNTNYYNGNISWITPKDLTGYRNIFIEKGERNITEEGFSSCSTRMLPKGTVLFSSRAPIGYVAIAKNELCTNQGFKSIIPNEKVYYLFLYYLIKYKKDYIAQFGSGTTFKEVSGNVMKEIEVEIPRNIQDQKRIAEVLYKIDKKIELNNQINNNLHEFCKNLYKEWFIKYNYPNKDDKMKESILGNIPYTWNVCKVQEITKIKRGASPRPIQDYICNEGINWLKISDVTGITEPYIYNIKEKIKEEGKSKSYFIEKGTLVVSNSATLGIPKFIEVDTCVHDGWLVLSEYKDYYKYFIYFLILNIRDKLVNMANGSVFQNLKTEILKDFEFVNPTDSVLIEFSKIINPLMEKIKKYVKENLVLEQLRDTLLPKLMNGEIDLENIKI